MLQEEERDKVYSKERHEEDVNEQTSYNQGFMQQLSTLLTTFDEPKKEED